MVDNLGMEAAAKQSAPVKRIAVGSPVYTVEKADPALIGQDVAYGVVVNDDDVLINGNPSVTIATQAAAGVTLNKEQFVSVPNQGAVVYGIKILASGENEIIGVI